MRLRRRTGVVETPDGWAPGARRQRAAPSCNGRQPMTPTFRPGDHDAPPAATMAPAPSRRARPTVLVLAGLLACPSLVQGAPRPQADDAAPPAPRDDAVEPRPLAPGGALVVRPRLVHAYAEYGEGEFHLVQRVEQVADATWRVEADVGIDVLPDPSVPADAVAPEVFRLDLRSDAMT